jgi:hypothetical protein
MGASKGWDSYWNNPGDSGLETRIAWNLPAGLAAARSAIRCPGGWIVSGLMKSWRARPPCFPNAILTHCRHKLLLVGAREEAS